MATELRVHFATKPGEELREKLKRLGWRWDSLRVSWVTDLVDAHAEIVRGGGNAAKAFLEGLECRKKSAKVWLGKDVIFIGSLNPDHPSQRPAVDPTIRTIDTAYPVAVGQQIKGRDGSILVVTEIVSATRYTEGLSSGRQHDDGYETRVRVGVVATAADAKVTAEAGTAEALRIDDERHA